MAAVVSKPMPLALASVATALSPLMLQVAEVWRRSGLARLPWMRLLRWSPLFAVAPVAFGVGTFFVLLRLLSRGVPLLPPTARQLSEEDLDANPLYRALPALKGKLAWRALGTFPTPVHRFSVSLAEKDPEDAEFWVKREDLSSDKYGGNKARTLQYILGALEAHLEDCKRRAVAGRPRLVVLGSGGSNLVVAAKVHAMSLGLPASALDCFCLYPDSPEMDNTLNFLSALSLPGITRWRPGMGPVFWNATQRERPGRVRPWVLAPGGISIPGILAQVGALMELAEQIGRGECPDPDGIVLCIGSACTVAGLILGVAVARTLGLPVLRKPGFRIHATLVHDELAQLHRTFGILVSERLPGQIGTYIHDTAAAIADLGGPDVRSLALTIMRQELVIGLDPTIIGKYGAHSAASLEAKALFESTAKGPSGAPGLWLCGHFSGKSFALMLKLLREDVWARRQPRRFVFWQTKSQVQPLGDAADEWAGFEAERKRSRSLARWGVLGGASGAPGAAASTAAAAGATKGLSAPAPAAPAAGPEEYRHLMTRVLGAGVGAK